MTLNIVIYSKDNCPNCTSAKALLKSKGLAFEERNIDAEPLWLEFLRKLELRQMPQIYINEQRVGGFAGLQAALKQLEGST